MKRLLPATVFFTVAATPLVYLPGRYLPVLEPPKAMVATAGCLVLLVLLILRRPMVGAVSLPARIALFALMAAYLGAAITIPIHGTRYALELARYLDLLVMVVATWQVAELRAPAWAGLLLASGVVSLLLLAEEWGWMPPGLILWPHSPAATLGHRNVAGHFILAGLAFATASLARIPGGQRLRIAGVAALVGVQLIALIATRSRTAFVAALLAMGLIAYGLRRLATFSPAKLGFVGVAVGLALTVHLLSPMTRAPRPPLPAVAPITRAAHVPTVRGRAVRLARRSPAADARFSRAPQTLTDRLTDWSNPDPVHARLEVWQFALRQLATHPLGVGPGQFRRITGRYWNAHNLCLHIGVELGVGVLVLALVALFALLRLSVRVLVRHADGAPEAHLVAAA
jgi:hypothetical protein